MFIKEKTKEYLGLWLCRHKNVQDFFVARKSEINLDGFDSSLRTFWDIDNESDFYKVCEKFNFFVPDADIKKRFADKSHFCLISEGDHFGCWGWYNSEQKNFYVLEIDRNSKIPSDTSVLFHFFSNPDFRRKGFYYDLLRNIAVKSDKTYYIIYSYDTNPASSGAIKKAGYRFAGRYGHKNFESFEKFIKDAEVQK